MKRTGWLLLLALTMVSPRGAAAHEPDQSYIFLRVYDDSMAVRIEIAVSDLERVLGFGWDVSGDISKEQIGEHLGAILAYVRPRLYLGAGGAQLPLRFNGYDVRRIEIAEYVLLEFTSTGLGAERETIEVGFPVMFEVDPAHRNLLVIEQNWRGGIFNNVSTVSLIFSPDAPRQELDLTASSVLRGFVGLLKLGVHHIWVGLDHILFLLALSLPSVLRRRERGWEPVTSFRPALVNIVGIITCFTLAHSLTLGLAALDVVRLPTRLVEATIAASIVAAALYNLFPQVQVREWMIALGFGLFHGFGFANVLAGAGLERDHLALSLLGFNLGVEIGQVVIICALFPALFLIRGWPAYRPILRYASMAMIVIAAAWFVERAFDVPLIR